ncbi:MAG: hypothetical protein AAGJ18_10910 [Bacteroidota bacterium]
MRLSKKINLLIWTILLVLPTLAVAQTVPTYQEKEGLIVIEVESATELGEWQLDTTILGFLGDNYLIYQGNNLFNDPGFSVLNYQIAIEKAGRYRFQWRSRIAQGTSNTEHNDSWLRFNDASDFYGEKGDTRVYPKGTGKTPNPNGSTRGGWFKIYQNSRGDWTWQTRTSDNDPHNIFVEFDTAGVYSLEIAGRSKGHAIDRLVLYHSDVGRAFATSAVRPESDRVQTVSIRDIPFEKLNIRPTLAHEVVYINFPKKLKIGEYEGYILDAFGRRVQAFSINLQGKRALGGRGR